MHSTSAATVILWRVNLSVAPGPADSTLRWLAAEDVSRAVRFKFDQDRRRFVLRRAARRLILGRHLDVAPADLQFTSGPDGKPCLDGPPAASGIGFNCASSADLALVAIAPGGDAGVDLERHRDLDADLRHVAKSFSPSERKLLRSRSGPAEIETFFELWTRKEAVLKARGSGLSTWLPELDVSPSSAAGSTRARVIRDPDGGREWWLSSLAVAPGFSAALAWNQRPEVVLRDWTW